MLSKLLFAAIASYVVLRGILYWGQYRGSRDPALLARVEKHFSREDIDRGLEYARRGFGARVARSALDLAVILAVLWAGGAAALSRLAVSWTGDRWWLAAAMVPAFLLLALTLIHLPFDYYLGHVLEHRFGFSTQTAISWLVVQGKSLALTIAVAVPLSLLWFWLLRALPRAWVAVTPAAVLLFQAALLLVVPAVLIPIYYHSKPLPPGPFRESVLGVLERAGAGVEEIFVIDESRYSTHTNAFFTGFGPSRRIYLYDTLLGDLPPGETLTVVAHEAGHWRGNHVLLGLLLGGLGLVAGCLFLRFGYPSLARALRWPALTDPASLLALALLALLAEFFTAPLESAVSRSFEREADRAGVELTGDRRAAVEAEERLARTNRSQLLPHPLVVAWYSSHPPAIERIEAAEGWAPPPPPPARTPAP